MIPFSSIVFLLILWIVIVQMFNGLPAMIDGVALALKRWARKLRDQQQKRERELAQAWIRELEQ